MSTQAYNGFGPAPRLNVAIIHGIGKNEEGYADDLIAGIEKAFGTCLEEMTGRPDDGEPKLRFKAVVWDDILGANQEKLKGILERKLKQKGRKSFLAFWTGAGIVPLAVAAVIFQTVFKQPWIFFIAFLAAGYAFYRFGTKLYYQLRTAFAAEFMMDIIGYLNADAKAMIQERVLESLRALDSDQEPVTLIAHSLGTVIASDFIWDRQTRRDFGSFQLANFFTMGSPMALFALRWGPELFNKPVRVDDPHGCWMNILDRDDPIAYPLKGLNEEYNEAVMEDREVNAGPFGVAHILYWKNADVHRVIGRKLAGDWVRIAGGSC